MMKRSQGEALATLVSRIRDDWDHPGILAAILKAQALGTPAQVSIALLRLTENRELRTPAILASPGAHWDTGTGTVTPPRKMHTMRCHEHPAEEVPCPRCKADARPPTEEEMAALMTKAKEARDYHAEMQRLQEQRKAAKG